MDARGSNLLHGVVHGLPTGAYRKHPMLRSRLPRDKARVLSQSPQLPLAIDDGSVLGQTTAVRALPLSLQKGVDPILWMRDLQALFDVHRCTIHRWIKRGEFPAKDAPAGSPRGWLRSTVLRWQLGSADARGTSGNRARKDSNARL